MKTFTCGKCKWGLVAGPDGWDCWAYSYEERCDQFCPSCGDRLLRNGLTVPYPWPLPKLEAGGDHAPV
jgi:hypothetical protein